MEAGDQESIEEGLDMTCISLKEDPVRSNGSFMIEEMLLDTNFRPRLT
jgi:hypothetical protein